MGICMLKIQERWYLTFSTCSSTLDSQHIWSEIWQIWWSTGPVKLDNLWVILVCIASLLLLIHLILSIYVSVIFLATLERYHSSCFKFRTEESTACSTSRSDAFAFGVEVPDRLRGAAAAGGSRFTSKSYTLKYIAFFILLSGRQGILVSWSVQWSTLPAGNSL